MTDYQPDILAFLEKVVHKNTLAYTEDFDIDVKTLQNSALESDIEHRSFFWLSRPNGTWCVPEREAFCGTAAHITLGRSMQISPKVSWPTASW